MDEGDKNGGVGCSPTKHFTNNTDADSDWKMQNNTGYNDASDGPIDANYPNNHNNLRRFRTSKNFKNPPQPHMCIREKTIDGQELFINVLSWTRIANPSDKNSPIPLFGGMRVPPGSPRSPPLVFAVMASPDVLKQAGRKCPETPERMNLIDLMCEFVEEMNPGLILSRKPEILKDRDLSGELKDVWSAVQALRERQRTPKTQQDQNLVLYTEFGPPDSDGDGQQFEQATGNNADYVVAAAAQQRETVIQYNSNQQPSSAINTNVIAADTIDSINSETENMRISPTEDEQQQHQSNNNQSQATSVIVANNTNTKSNNSQVTASPATTKKDKESTNHSHLFFPKFRSKSSSNTTTTTTSTTADENNTSTTTESNNSEKPQTTSNNNSKKGLNFFRRKLSPKNEKPDINTDNKEILSSNTSITTNKDKQDPNGKEIHHNTTSSSEIVK